MKRKVILLVSLLACACEAERIEVIDGCFTTADCPPKTVCNAYEGRCEDEPEAGFIGTFRCTVDSKDISSSMSDITGTIAGERYVLFGNPGCSLEDTAGDLMIGVVLPSNHDLYLGLSLGGVTESGRFELTTATSLFAPKPSAAFADWPSGPGWRTEARVLAYSARGFGYLRESAVSGEVLSGFVSIEMQPTPADLLDWGASCARNGAATCGHSLDALCAEGASGAPFCTRECSEDSPCEEGLVCLEGLCLLECTEDGDCPPHLSCDTSSETGGCW